MSDLRRAVNCSIFVLNLKSAFRNRPSVDMFFATILRRQPGKQPGQDYTQAGLLSVRYCSPLEAILYSGGLPTSTEMFMYA